MPAHQAHAYPKAKLYEKHHCIQSKRYEKYKWYAPVKSATLVSITLLCQLFQLITQQYESRPSRKAPLYSR